jgi:hypothetical protein
MIPIESFELSRCFLHLSFVFVISDNNDCVFIPFELLTNALNSTLTIPIIVVVLPVPSIVNSLQKKKKIQVALPGGP